MIAVFYSGIAGYGGLLVGNMISRLSLLRYLFAMFAGLFFLLSLAATISFISLYIYELPTHHCPFDMLQKSSNFVGYPIYLSRSPTPPHHHNCHARSSLNLDSFIAIAFAAR
jgi:hypothetical protein